MELEKVCGICGRTYAVKPVDLSSSVNITLEMGKNTEQFDSETCPLCAYKILRHINSLQMLRPKKCEFCAFDKGPRAAVKHSECEECINFNNFQLKKRMSLRQAYEWEKYKGYLCGEDQYARDFIQR